MSVLVSISTEAQSALLIDNNVAVETVWFVTVGTLFRFGRDLFGVHWFIEHSIIQIQITRNEKIVRLPQYISILRRIGAIVSPFACNKNIENTDY